MRKIMLLAAMLAMVLAAAAPALGQGDVNFGDDQFNVGDETTYSAVCQNIIGSFDADAGQYASADVDAVAGDNAVAVSEIAQEQNVSVEQVNQCLNQFFAKKGMKKFHSVSATPTAKTVSATPTAKTVSATSTATATPTATATSTATATATATASATALPATGGLGPSSALALGAGALLVASGLVARRIVR